MNVASVLLVRVSSAVDKEVGHPQFFDPSYPLKYLQAGLKRHKDMAIYLQDCWINPMTTGGMVDLVRRLAPDMVVVSASSFDVDVADQLVADLKNMHGQLLVIGIGQGYYRTEEGADQDTRFDRQKIYDAVLLGEPEQEFFRLLERISKDGQDAGWRVDYGHLYGKGRRFVVENPDALPFPSYTPAELRAYRAIFPVRIPRRVRWGYLIATRGCPHGCLFCSEVMRVSIGRRLRCRSADSVVDEMEHLASQGANICSFQDDSLSANRGFVRRLCDELIRRKSEMPWMARARVDELDWDQLQRMRRAGCILLGIGVESGCQRIIDAMHKTTVKRPWADMCRPVFAWTRELGIGTNAYYVIGNPTETEGEIRQTIEFALELNADSIQVHFYTLYPGSAAWELYRDRVADDDPGKMFHYAIPAHTLARVSPGQLAQLRSEFYRRYLFRPRFALTHLRHYGRFYLHNPDILWNLLRIRKVF